jgi:hypothetical protein
MVAAFPLGCLAEDCNHPRTQIEEVTAVLGELKTMNLLRAAMDSHIQVNLNLWQFCIIPDCEGIYRRDGSSRVAHCSACGISTCTNCKDEKHEGLSCSDYQVAKLPPDRLHNKITQEILMLVAALIALKPLWTLIVASRSVAPLAAVTFVVGARKIAVTTSRYLLWYAGSI